MLPCDLVKVLRCVGTLMHMNIYEYIYALLHLAWLLMICQIAVHCEENCAKVRWLSKNCVDEAPRPQEVPLLPEYDGNQFKPTQSKVVV